MYRPFLSHLLSYQHLTRELKFVSLKHVLVLFFLEVDYFYHSVFAARVAQSYVRYRYLKLLFFKKNSF